MAPERKLKQPLPITQGQEKSVSGSTSSQCLEPQAHWQPGPSSTTVNVSKEIALLLKVRQTMGVTAKADKYVRMCCSVVKLMRARDTFFKTKSTALYKQLLKLRQVLRWNGAYETVIELHQLDWSRPNLGEFLFKVLHSFGDVLDRIMFTLEILDNRSHDEMFRKLEGMEANCYFIECVGWLLYHCWTFQKTSGVHSRRLKAAKTAKYAIDCVTSYCKFSRRVGQLQPTNIAALNIVSSVLGLFTILY